MINVIFFSLIGGLLSLLGGLILFRDSKKAHLIASYTTPFAAGVLLATALVDLLPESVEIGGNDSFFTWTLLGIIGFFLLERYVRVFHHHHEHKVGEGRAKNSLIVIGDTLHNLIDGAAIGAAFLVDTPTGIVAALAVAAHEIPQEIGDFGLLLRGGMKKSKVILVNVISAMATVLAAISVYAFGSNESAFLPYILAITAGFFIYIAASDIIPSIHENTKKYDIRPWLLVLGAILMMIISPLAHDYIDAAHGHDHSISESSHDHSDDHDDHDHVE